jgi:hypothetical protein
MAAYGDYPYAPPFPPDTFGVRLGAPVTVVLSATNLFASPVVVPSGGTLVSSIVDTHDFSLVAFGFVSGDAIQVSIQPFLDLEGTIPVGSPTVISSTTTGSTQVPTDLFFRAVQITLSNSGNSAAQVTKADLVVRAVSI